MITSIGIVVIAVGLLVWIRQSLRFLAPDIATRIGLNSPEEEQENSEIFPILNHKHRGIK